MQSRKRYAPPPAQQSRDSHERRLARSAVVLQRFWRGCVARQLTTGALIRNQIRSGATSLHMKSISFERMVVELREISIIKAARECVRRIHLLATKRHGSPPGALAPENVNVRVVLAGFMAAYRPTHVFETMGPLECSLHESAIALIQAFEAICERMKDGTAFANVPHEVTRDLNVLLFEYLKRFKAWKVPDEAKLTMRIKHALVALYQAREHLPPDEPEDSKLSVEFRTQIERMRAKLAQIAGQGALKAFDERERPAIGGGAGGPPGGPGGSVYGALPGRMSNEQLAHELLLDPTFQLDESGGCDVENPVFKRIRESFHQAFWDSLVDDLNLPAPSYVRVISVLCEIRDGINDLVGSNSLIDEVLDMEFIRQQADAGLYTWDRCRGLVAGVVAVIQRVQEPSRDEETREKWRDVSDAMDAEPGARTLCKGLEFLLNRVNAMRIDAANSRLRLIASVVKHHGADYERSKFQGKLDNGTLTLERVTAWIDAAVRSQTPAVREDLLEGRVSAFVRVHMAAMLALVVDPVPIRLDACPETLHLDVHRLLFFQREFRYIVSSGALYATAGFGGFDFGAFLANRPDLDGALDEMRAQVPPALADNLVRCVLPGDRVYRVMELRVRSCVGHIIGHMELPAEATSLAPLVPRMRRLGERLLSLANINRTVHLPTYNRLIFDAARRAV